MDATAGDGLLERSDAVEDLAVDGLVGGDVGEEHAGATANDCLAAAGHDRRRSRRVERTDGCRCSVGVSRPLLSFMPVLKMPRSLS